MHTEALNTLRRHRKAVEETNPIRVNGRITRVVGLVMEGHGPGSSIGEFCHVYPRDGSEPVQCEGVGFTDDKILLMPLGEVRGIGPGSKIVARRSTAAVGVGAGLLGRTLDGLGAPID